MSDNIGGISVWNSVTVTGDYTAANREAVNANASSAAIAISLPTGAKNAYVSIKKIDSTSNTITVSGVGTIDGAGSLSISAQYDAYTLICDGANWHVVAEPASAEPAYYDVKFVSGFGGITALGWAGGGRVIAGTHNYHIWKSDEPTINTCDFEDMGVVGSDDIMNVCYCDGDIILCSDYDHKVYKSVDGGVTWSDLGISLARAGVINALYTKDGIVVYVVSGWEWVDIYTSSDYGASPTRVFASTISELDWWPVPGWLGEWEYLGELVGVVFTIYDLQGPTFGCFAEFSYDWGVSWLTGFELELDHPFTMMNWLKTDEGKGIAIGYSCNTVRAYYIDATGFPTVDVTDLGGVVSLTNTDRTNLNIYCLTDAGDILTTLKLDTGHVYIRPTGTGDWTDVGTVPEGAVLGLSLLGIGYFIYGGWAK